MAGHAALWNGSAIGWVDLNPTGYDYSHAWSVSNGRQVGYVGPNWYGHAALWSGTSASFVDLHPAGYGFSEARGVCGDEQVGYAYFGEDPIASLWTGTAESWVNLNPAGAITSLAQSVSSGFQVGNADFGAGFHAGMWSGTAESWVDLHASLSADYNWSYAHGIEVTDSDIWIVGSAQNIAAGRYEAVLWHNVIPEPSSLLAVGGIDGAGRIGAEEKGIADHPDFRLQISNFKLKDPFNLKSAI